MDNLLLEICGKELFFDIDKLSDICKIEEVDTDEDISNDIEKLPLMENMGLQ